jgi:sensor domain CHASE-containing protein
MTAMEGNMETTQALFEQLREEIVRDSEGLIVIEFDPFWKVHRLILLQYTGAKIELAMHPERSVVEAQRRALASFLRAFALEKLIPCFDMEAFTNEKEQP